MAMMLLVVVLGGSEADDENHASFRGVAEEPVLAGIGPIQRWANAFRLPFARPKEKSPVCITLALSLPDQRAAAL